MSAQGLGAIEADGIGQNATCDYSEQSAEKRDEPHYGRSSEDSGDSYEPGAADPLVYVL
jgi:hypothetical protein